MARFTTNIARDQNEKIFNSSQKFLYEDSLIGLQNDKIEKGVSDTMLSMKELLSTNMIHMVRQPNSENRLYLNLLEKIQEEHNMKLINILSSKMCHLFKTNKP